MALHTSTHLTDTTFVPLFEPLQRKCLCKSTNFLHIETNIFMKDKKNTWVKFNTEFKRATLPPRLTNLFLQVTNLLETSLIRGSQIPPFFGFAPTGSPKYLKGKELTLQWRKPYYISKKDLLTLTPKRLLLARLTFRPETSLKLLKTVLIVKRLSTGGTPTNIM